MRMRKRTVLLSIASQASLEPHCGRVDDDPRGFSLRDNPSLVETYVARTQHLTSELQWTN
jgi:hypothetical protein